MRMILIAVAASLFAVGCGSNVPAPTSSPSPRPSLLPLPANMGVIPGEDEFSTEIAPHSRRGELEIGVARNFPLAHCGLASPIDIDGSLWDPIGGHNGAGGALTEDQVGDLINGTQTVVVLIDSDTMELLSANGAVVTLTRHDGPRGYFGCD